MQIVTSAEGGPSALRSWRRMQPYGATCHGSESPRFSGPLSRFAQSCLGSSGRFHRRSTFVSKREPKQASKHLAKRGVSAV